MVFEIVTSYTVKNIRDVSHLHIQVLLNLAGCRQFLMALADKRVRFGNTDSDCSSLRVPLKESASKEDLRADLSSSSQLLESDTHVAEAKCPALPKDVQLSEESDEEEEEIQKPKKVLKTKKELGILPARFEDASKFQGYGIKIDALYRTTGSDYGSRPPTELTMPTRYYGFTTKFTTHLSVCGMYRNHSVNSKLDK